MLPGRWGIGVGVGIRKSIVGRLNGTGRDPKPKEHSAAAVWKSFRVPGAEFSVGVLESKVLIFHMWFLDLNLKSMKSNLENLKGVASDLCVGKSFWLQGGGTHYRSGEKLGDLH